MTRDAIANWLGDCTCTVARADASAIELTTVAQQLTEIAAEVRALAKQRRDDEHRAVIQAAADRRLAKVGRQGTGQHNP